MSKLTSRTALLTSICPLALAISLNAQAQDNQETNQLGSLEEIVVTAQKRAQSANDIGMAISAVSGDVLRDLQIDDTSELANAVPGLTFSDSGFSTPVYSLRGVGFSENSVQAASTVGVYHDQIAVPYPIMTKGLMMDVERLEVLKGPQGTLYGRNSTGGAINYIANKPTEEFEAFTSVSYGSFETLDASGVVSGAFSDTVRARLAVRTVQASEGWQESITRDDTHGEQDRTSARLLFDIDPSDSLSLSIAANWWEDKSDTQLPQLWFPEYGRPSNDIVVGFQELVRTPIFGTDDAQATDWPTGNSRLGSGPTADMSGSSLAITLNWALSDSMELTSLSSYSTFDNNSRYTNDQTPGLPFETTFNGVRAIDTLDERAQAYFSDDIDTLAGIWYINDSTIDAWSQELRLSGETESVNWLAGIYMSSDEIDSDTPQIGETSTNVSRAASPPFVSSIGVSNPTETNSDAWAVFAHTEWTVSDALNLTVGLRYTDEQKDFEGCSADLGLGDTSTFLNTLFGQELTEPGGCTTLDENFMPVTAEAELNEDSFSGRLGLDWNVNDDLLTYVSYSRGFKAGSFPTFTATDERQFQPVVQEQLDAFELGLKATLLDGQMQFNGAAFYYDYKDKQLMSKVVHPIFGPVNALVNAPESEVRGLEFDVQWAPVQGLYLSMSATYTDTEVTEFTAFNQFGVFGDMAGSSFPLAPELQINALAKYEWGINDNLNAFVGADVSYSDESTTDYAITEVQDPGTRGYVDFIGGLGFSVGDTAPIADAFLLDSYTLFGVQAGIKSSDDRWVLSLWGRNITDEYVVNNTRNSGDSILAWTGMPTTWGVTFDYSWD
jgi:outer membrane receptor protein involved in Fe transport